MNTGDFSPFGIDLFGQPIKQNPASPISQKFIMPPFTVLSARDGDWQQRKAAWIAMGIESEVGRKNDLIGSLNTDETARRRESEYGFEAGSMSEANGLYANPTSIFDPVLCEIIYKWFSAPGHQVVDPFAGGSVRGVVASCLGREYWGGELRSEQVEANREQAGKLCGPPYPEYCLGDSEETLKTAPEADLIFSCPPYHDLEVYSDLAEDLSNMDFEGFTYAYRRIIYQACKRLKNNRFAVFVVGDFRDKSGHYRNFVSETIACFLSCDLDLYNEAILVTAVGSAALRCTRQFEAGRKMVKTHQNVLVFVKGDWKKATEACGGRQVPSAEIAPAEPLTMVGT